MSHELREARQALRVARMRWLARNYLAAARALSAAMRGGKS